MPEQIIAFSIVIPLYNKETTVSRAIHSILNQAVQDFEIIIVNDGSTDNGPAVVKSISDARIRLIHQENEGVSAARNRGIAEAKFDFIAFLDADDEWLPDYLKTIQGMIIRYPECGLYATRYFLRSHSGNQRIAIVRGLPTAFEGVMDDYFRIASCSEPPVWSGAVCVRKSDLLKIGGFPVGVTSGEDLLTWAKLALIFKIAYSDSALSIFNVDINNGGSIFRVPAPRDFVGLELFSLINKYHSNKYLRKYYALWKKMLAVKYLKLDNKSKARIEIETAIKFDLFNFKLWILYFLSIFPLRIIK